MRFLWTNAIIAPGQFELVQGQYGWEHKFDMEIASSHGFDMKMELGFGTRKLFWKY